MRKLEEPSSAPPSSGSSWAIAFVLGLALCQWAWNASSLPPLRGYDAIGHAAYVETIASEGRLPHPLEAWSTFHPPFYYLSGALVWRLTESLGPGAVLWGLRALSGAAWLAIGVGSFLLVRMLGQPRGVAALAASLALFVPCSQMASTMLGNEAFGAGLAALALLFVMRLQRDPRDQLAALGASLFAGLALATKYTGLFVAVAAVVPFLRRDLDVRMLRAALLGLAVAACVAGPVYVRNVALTGSVVPMTREREPMRGLESILIVRERRWQDYVWLDPRVLRRPKLHRSSEQLRREGPELNPVMANVWSLTLASAWFDAHGVRFSQQDSRPGSALARAASLLLLLGLVPTALVGLGLVAAAREVAKAGTRSPGAPLVVMAAAAVTTFVAFSWRAPSTAALKASYLLPLAAPAAVFYAGGLSQLGPRLRGLCIGLSVAAAAAAALVFADGLAFRAQPNTKGSVRTWQAIARELDAPQITNAMRFFLGHPESGRPRVGGSR